MNFALAHLLRRPLCWNESATFPSSPNGRWEWCSRLFPWFSECLVPLWTHKFASHKGVWSPTVTAPDTFKRKGSGRVEEDLSFMHKRNLQAAVFFQLNRQPSRGWKRNRLNTLAATRSCPGWNDWPSSKEEFWEFSPHLVCVCLFALTQSKSLEPNFAQSNVLHQRYHTLNIRKKLEIYVSASVIRPLVFCGNSCGRVTWSCEFSRRFPVQTTVSRFTGFPRRNLSRALISIRSD